MNKQEFLHRLQQGLAPLPPEQQNEHLAFYSEMIDDRLEDGLSEEEAVAAIGSPEEIAAQILANTPLSQVNAEQSKPRRGLKTWEIVLLAVCSPIWVPLLIAAASVIFSLLVVLWSLIITLWAVGISLVAGTFAGIAAAVLFIVQGHGLTGLAMLGAGLICAGLSVFLFFGCVAASKGGVRLVKKAFTSVKRRLAGKGTVQ